MCNSFNRKPENSLFKQQRLPAWQPVYSPKYVSIFFMCLSALFIGFGLALTLTLGSTYNIELRYDDRACRYNGTNGVLSFNVGNETFRQGCRTTLSFTINSSLSPPIYMYYGLSNFYQNHRKYTRSKDNDQIRGVNVQLANLYNAVPVASPGGTQFSTNDGGYGKGIQINNSSVRYGDMIYSPAGLMPWSMFNDTMALYYQNATSSQRQLVCNTSLFSRRSNEFTVAPSNTSLYRLNGRNTSLPWISACYKKGIAWESDVRAKFLVPFLNDRVWSANRDFYRARKPNSNDTYFLEGWYAGEAGHSLPVNTDEDFIVWMHAAILPKFRKLFRVINYTLVPGTYEIDIIQTFNVSQFQGHKYFILTKPNFAGIYSIILNLEYIIAGGICLLTAICILIYHCMHPNRVQEAIDLLNTKENDID